MPPLAAVFGRHLHGTAVKVGIQSALRRRAMTLSHRHQAAAAVAAGGRPVTGSVPRDALQVCSQSCRQLFSRNQPEKQNVRLRAVELVMDPSAALLYSHLHHREVSWLQWRPSRTQPLQYAAELRPATHPREESLEFLGEASGLVTRNAERPALAAPGHFEDFLRKSARPQFCNRGIDPFAKEATSNQTSTTSCTD